MKKGMLIAGVVAIIAIGTVAVIRFPALKCVAAPVVPGHMIRMSFNGEESPYACGFHTVYFLYPPVAGVKDASVVTLVGADPFSFAPSPSLFEFAKDKKNVYFYGEIVPGVHTVDPILAPTSKIFTGYVKVAADAGTRIYAFVQDQHYGPLHSYKELTDADPATFRVLYFGGEIEGYGQPTGYAIDSKHVYYQETTLDLDPATFTMAMTQSGNTTIYAKDASHVYYERQLLPGADVKTFRLVTDPAGQQTRYAADATHVYHDASLLSGVDAPTFVILTPSSESAAEYAKDAKNVYFFDKVIPGADPATFVFDKDETSHDKYRSYHGDQPVTE